MKTLKISLLSIAGLFFLFIILKGLSASSSGVTGKTKRNGNTNGCTCHNSSPSSSVSVIINGPSSVIANDTATFQLKLTGGPLVAGGCNISAFSGQVITSPLDNTLKRLLAGSVFELTHISPKLSSSDTITWTFRYVAPNTPGGNDTLFATGNSVNNNNQNSGDMWNFAFNKIINITGSSSITGESGLSNGYKLSQNYPNPFNPATIINYSIPKNNFVTLKIYDELGRELLTLVNDYQRAGDYEIKFDSENSGLKLTSGIYYYRIKAGGFTDTKKMLLVK